jgi:SAM-dependent methyltransferase
MESPIIGAAQARSDWAGTPAGRAALAWEMARFDAVVSDVFGYYALQCGPLPIDCLRESRIRHRIRAAVGEDPGELANASGSQVLLSRFEELPFASQSLDLVALPHVLEFSEDPHAVLREVERVLRPEGRLLISGVNPVSLWGARRLLPRRFRTLFPPDDARLIGAPRLRDWLRLLGFEPNQTRYGCYRPAILRDEWFDRAAFLERAGDRWWPICGSVYFAEAVKRVRSIRLIGTRDRRTLRGVHEPVPLASRTASRRVISDTCSRGSSAAD